MNTPAHLIFGAAGFSRPDRRGSFAAAIAGSLAPDLSLYLMAGWSLFVMDIPPRTVFGEYYYSDAWQSIFAVDNSFILWGAVVLLALWLKRPLLFAFAGAGFLHLLFDFPLHTHDARQHFWPVSDWVFYSPFSYWDSAAHADIIGTASIGLCVALAVVVIRRFESWVVRGFTALLLALELASSGFWSLVF